MVLQLHPLYNIFSGNTRVSDQHDLLDIAHQVIEHKPYTSDLDLLRVIDLELLEPIFKSAAVPSIYEFQPLLDIRFVYRTVGFLQRPYHKIDTCGPPSIQDGLRCITPAVTFDLPYSGITVIAEFLQYLHLELRLKAAEFISLKKYKRYRP